MKWLRKMLVGLLVKRRIDAEFRALELEAKRRDVPVGAVVVEQFEALFTILLDPDRVPLQAVDDEPMPNVEKPK